MQDHDFGSSSMTLQQQHYCNDLEVQRSLPPSVLLIASRRPRFYPHYSLIAFTIYEKRIFWPTHARPRLRVLKHDTTTTAAVSPPILKYSAFSRYTLPATTSRPRLRFLYIPVMLATFCYWNGLLCLLAPQSKGRGTGLSGTKAALLVLALTWLL